MIEIAAFSALGAVGTADLVLVVSSRFKIGILCFLDDSGWLASRSCERGEAYLSSLEDRYSIYLDHHWLLLGYGWVSFGLLLGFIWVIYRRIPAGFFIGFGASLFGRPPFFPFL